VNESSWTGFVLGKILMDSGVQEWRDEVEIGIVFELYGKKTSKQSVE
jgi:hypothetical protein